MLLSPWLMVVALGAPATDAAAETPITGQLKAPVKIEAGGKPIDVEIGHAAPFFADFDGDGRRDLLVGQFGGGKLRIYKNAGTNAEPRFADFTTFQADGRDGTVPAG